MDIKNSLTAYWHRAHVIWHGKSETKIYKYIKIIILQSHTIQGKPLLPSPTIGGGRAKLLGCEWTAGEGQGGTRLWLHAVWEVYMVCELYMLHKSFHYSCWMGGLKSVSFWTVEVVEECSKRSFRLARPDGSHGNAKKKHIISIGKANVHIYSFPPPLP